MDRVDSNTRERLECLHCQQGLDRWTYSDDVLHQRSAAWAELNQPTLGRAAGCHPSSHEPNSNKLENQRSDPVGTNLAKDLANLGRGDEVTLPSEHISLRVVTESRVSQAELHVLRH